MASQIIRRCANSASPSNQHLKQMAFNQLRMFSSEKTMRGLVLGIYQGEGDREPKLTASAEKMDERIGGRIFELVQEAKLNGKVGAGQVFSGVDDEFRSVAIVGVGREGTGFNENEVIDEGMENVRVAAGAGAYALQRQGCTEILVDGMDYPEQAAEGAGLAVFRYDEHVRKHKRRPLPSLELFDSQEVEAWTRGLFKAEAQNLTRRLTDAPANQMTPGAFAQATVDALCPCGASVEIRTSDWIEARQLNSFMMIAKGSCEPPVLLEVSYCGSSPEDKPVLLLGKGITFNSGGLSLRKCKGMAEYRGSMAGAAVCVGVIRAAAALSLPINITAVMPLCEHMPSGMACKPGDVVKLLNGRTLCVRDLDQAGVAMMADPLLYAQSTYKPRMLVDIATLGRGVVSGLGGSASGLFTNSDYIWKEFQGAGSLTGDRVWRLPLWRYFKELITKHDTYDFSNTGKGPASSCLQAAVLHQLVPCLDWAHLDIRGTGMLGKHAITPYLRPGLMTGRPVRTVVQFLYQIACPDAK